MKSYKKILLSLSLTLVLCVNGYFLMAQQPAILPEISYLFMEKLIATAKENYPRVKSLNSQVEAAKNDLSIAKTSWLEPFSFQYVVRSNQTNTNLVTVTTQDVLTGYQFGVSFNPASLFSKPATVKKAKKQVEVAIYSKEEYDLSLEAEVKTRYFAYLQSQKSLRPLTDALLDAENNLKVIKLAFQKAEVKLADYNAASISYNQTFASKLQAETTYLTAKAALEELTVKKLEEIK
ncbi:outer membrane protein TolC [Pedobacter sp. UYP24]